MVIVCFGFNGALTPEVWIKVALNTGIDELKLPTRAINDFDFLMIRRLETLKKLEFPVVKYYSKLKQILTNHLCFTI